MSLATTVKSIQDIMRKDVGVDGDAQRISQLAWMLFLKFLDDRELEQEIKDKTFKSPIPEKYRWRNWAADNEGITGDSLSEFVNNELFPMLQCKRSGLKVGEADSMGVVIRGVFEDSYNYMKNGTLLRQVINKIQSSFNLNNMKSRHALGTVYEKILKDLQSAGNSGEYYTPRAVTEFIIDRLDPKLGETILDPACGTGGFLTCAIEHVRDKYVKKASEERTLQKSIRGVEKKALPHLLCTTNMLIHGIDVPHLVRHSNTLGKPYKEIRARDRVDVIPTNPPFGGMEEDGIEQNYPATFRTRETADLFLVYIMAMLKPMGRSGIVLPDGSLFGEGVKTRIKEKLMHECNLHTIIRLPNGVFNPYTGIKTNLLFFTKIDKDAKHSTKEVWYYEHPYPDGAKSYNKTNPIDIKEFKPEMKWWGKPDTKGGFKGRKENDFAWRVAADEIIGNGYNLDVKNPNAPEHQLGDPEELLSELQSIEDASRKLLNSLKEELAIALCSSAEVGGSGN